MKITRAVANKEVINETMWCFVAIRTRLAVRLATMMVVTIAGFMEYVFQYDVFYFPPPKRPVNAPAIWGDMTLEGIWANIVVTVD